MKKIILIITFFVLWFSQSFALDIAWSTYDSVSYWVWFYVNDDLHFNSDWTKMYLHNWSNDRIDEYVLSTAWLVSSASYNQSKSYSAQTWSAYNVTFSKDWYHFYVQDVWTYIIYQYNMSTAWDISTASYYNSKTLVLWYRSFDWADDWWKFYIVSNNDNVYQYSASTPYNITTITSDSKSIWVVNSYEFWLKFINDWTEFFVVSKANHSTYSYILSTPFDVSTASFNDSYSSVSQTADPYWLAFNNDYSKMYLADWGATSTIYQYSTNDLLGPPDLAFTSTWEIIPIQDWFTLSWTIINIDYEIIDLEIYKYEAWTPYLLDNDIRVISQTWSWWVEVSLDILSDWDFSFSTFQDYEIYLEFKDLSWTWTISNWFTYWDYVYNSWYDEPVEEDFSFTTSWFDFFENWFALLNFIPDPIWWDLYFDIIAPNPEWTGTIDLETESFNHYSVDWDWYGFDSTVMVTYPYHVIGGIYQVRAVYDYDNLVIYPFWTWYLSYVITLPESSYDLDLAEMDCDTDLNWYISDSEEAQCLEDTWFWLNVKKFFVSIPNIFTKTKTLFNEVQKMSTPVWSKDLLNFIIPWVYASNDVVDSWIYDNFDDDSLESYPLFKNLRLLWKSLLLFMMFLVLFGWIYLVRS